MSIIISQTQRWHLLSIFFYLTISLKFKDIQFTMKHADSVWDFKILTEKKVV